MPIGVLSSYLLSFIMISSVYFVRFTKIPFFQAKLQVFFVFSKLLCIKNVVFSIFLCKFALR